MNVRPSSNTQSIGTHSARARGLAHVDPADVSLQTALEALVDPVRRSLLQQLAGQPDWSKACGTFDVPVSAATRSHHFTVLREAGLVEQRDVGRRRLNRLRRDEFEAAFPGLLDAVLSDPVSRRLNGASRATRRSA
jgi:DNA-binding transcriptional ArsR family regulator